jgi:hypothetical protein
MNRHKNLKPTESELEILSILWEKQQATVRAVHEELSKSKESGYTTTLKLMQIMHEKNLVTRDDSSKSHIYMATVSKSHTQNQFINLMIDNLFSGSPSDLVLQALGNSRHTNDDLEKIQQMINELKHIK